MHFLPVYSLLFVSGFWIEALVISPFSVMHLMIFPLKHAFLSRWDCHDDNEIQ